MANCGACGEDYLRCNCQAQQPFCDQCTEDNSCESIMDADCTIYHPEGDLRPSKLINLGMPNNSSVSSILEAIDGFLTSNANIPIAKIDTPSIAFTLAGGANHVIKADAKISATPFNQIEIKPDGLFVPISNPDYFVKVNEDDAPDYLINQVIGDTDGFVSISITEESGQVKVKPSLDISCILNSIQNDPDLLAQLCQLVDKCKCFIGVSNLSVTFSPACGAGYTLNELGTLCVSTEEVAPTLSNTVVTACPASFSQYGQYGALVYVGGFSPSGTGIGATLGADSGAGNVVAITTNEVWRNNTSAGNNFGPVNRAGLWDCAGVGAGQLGFTIPINVPATKTYYIGIAADDEFKLQVDGTTIVDTSLTTNTYWSSDGGAMFRFWHVYPVTLTQGVRYINVIGVDTGGVQSVLAAEIYDNTLAELQAAALAPAFLANRAGYPLTSNHYANLNLVFSTRCARQPGSTFTVGNATCPDSSWALDTTGGAPLVAPCQGINNNTAAWVCKKVVTTPFTGYTATVVWDRLSDAISYDVQQKLHSEPESAYVSSVGSPVSNVFSGSTATLVITGLSTNEYDFRVRANYSSCSSDWNEALAVII